MKITRSNEYSDKIQILARSNIKLSASNENTSFDEYEDEIHEIGQEFTSENTSTNSGKLPAIFKLVNFEPGTINLDYGGGKFDNVAEYLIDYDVINLVYDPYNRSREHNQEVIRMIRDHGGADTVTLSNVLNVIKEPEVRLHALQNIRKLVKPSGTVYITVYEGTRKGNEGPTTRGYQLNKKTADYLDEIRQVFPDAVTKGKLIIAHPVGDITASVTLFDSINSADIEPDFEDLLSEIQSEVYTRAKEVMTSYEFGFPENEINDYLFVDSSFDGRNMIIEVRAELSYDGMVKLANELDPIVDNYCNGAYFDMEQPGIMVAWLPSDSINVEGVTSVTSASYGGAYDIEDDMFFTREEINEFAYEIADQFSAWADELFEVSDVYIDGDDSTHLHIELSNDDIYVDSDVKIDMRKIRKPSDIYKYTTAVLKDMKDTYNDYHWTDESGDGFNNTYASRLSSGCRRTKAASAVNIDKPDPESVYGGEWSEASDTHDSIFVDLDADIILDDMSWQYVDTSYPWADVDRYSNEYPGLELRDKMDVTEDVDAMLDILDLLPEQPGLYHISGNVELVYKVSDVWYSSTYYGESYEGGPEIDEEYDTDDASVELDTKESKITNFKAVRLD